MQDQKRQGDIFFTRTELPDHAQQLTRKPGQRIAVALGEVTGHAHAVWNGDVVAFAEPGEVEIAWLSVPDAAIADVVHEEHGTIRLDPG
ncbi:hypothetical protein LCGC14_1735260, partial [marine sediment metagenome]